MAILDILTYEGITGIHEVARGDIGVLVDVHGGGLHEAMLPALGGACIYPSENDVRDGTVFGTIYTGNLQLPIESDVLVGVGYGSNGTELTGTATGGGSPFISIVNE